jgi:wyosine [tRNA(Phe)-imidazoG37] synthetase (radical SAM superfamily)
MDLQAGIVYGPVQSRRLGRFLGVNLAPADCKACSFNCVYCQYGRTTFPLSRDWPRPGDVIDAVDQALTHTPDVDHITVAGNGEPTLHPAFAPIAEGLFHVRARRAPTAKLALLSNGSALNRLEVVHGLSKFDVRSMKLDAGDATTFRLVNGSGLSLGRLLADLRAIGDLTLQSTFVQDGRGIIDNTTPSAIEAWLEAVSRVRPRQVDLCTVGRSTVGPSLRSVVPSTLEKIAARVSALGIQTRVFA